MANTFFIQNYIIVHAFVNSVEIYPNINKQKNHIND